MWLGEDKNLHDRRGTEIGIEVRRLGPPTDEDRPAPSYVLPCLLLACSSLFLLLFPLTSTGNRTIASALWADALYGLSAVAIALLAKETFCRRKIEQTLRRQKREAGIVENLSRLGSWSWQANGDVLQLSKSARDLLGVRAEGVLRLSDLFRTFYREDARELDLKISSALCTGRPFTAEARIAGDGEPRWIEVSCVVDEDEISPARRTWVGTVADVSSRKSKEREIETTQGALAQCLRGEMLGGLSGALAHELKQPLAAILSNAQAAERMLRRNPIDVDELGETLRDIIKDDSRAGEMILHLRSLFKNDDKDWTILELNQTVQEAAKIVNGSLLERDIDLVWKLSKTPLFVRGNGIQLQQVILNLVLNAAEAMSEMAAFPKQLVVETRSDNSDFATIAVSDTGPGLPETITQGIFEPFFSTKPHGLGLGLSICRSIVVAHGGRVSATSNPERGATFTVDLPFMRETPNGRS